MVETNSNIVSRLVEFRVVAARRDDIPGILTGQRIRNERTDEKPRNRRIAVGKMKERGTASCRITGRRIAHALDRRTAGLEFQSRKAGITHGPAIEGRNSIDPETPFAFR